MTVATALCVSKRSADLHLTSSKYSTSILIQQEDAYFIISIKSLQMSTYLYEQELRMTNNSLEKTMTTHASNANDLFYRKFYTYFY